MRRLVFDTATDFLSVALFDDADGANGVGGRLIGHVHERVGRGHAERLLPAIAALDEGGRADAVLVGCGPGSFTGIRVAIAAARALGFAWNVPVQGFGTLALIAANAVARSGLDRSAIAVAIDGGHGEWLVTEPLADPEALSPERAAAAICAGHVAGARAPDLVALRGWGEAIEAEADARAACGLVARDVTSDVSPRYARAPDAKVASA